MRSSKDDGDVCREYVAVAVVASGAVALSAIVTSQPAAAPGIQDARQQVSMRMTHGRKALMRLSGTEGKPGRFAVTVRLPRVPCSGVYRFAGEGDDLDTGGSSSYRARLRLTRQTRSKRRPKCGHRIASGAGRSGGALTVRTRPNTGQVAFSVTGRRAARGVFRGELRIYNLLCNGKRYYLNARFRDGKRRWRYRYRVRVSGARYNGRLLNC